MSAHAIEGHGGVDSLVRGLAEQMMESVPFSAMSREHVHEFLEQCIEQYYEPDEIILQPGSESPRYLYLIRQGTVTGQRVASQGESAYFELEPADLFPVGAVLTRRPVSTIYRALSDCFCLQFPVEKIVDFGARCPEFLTFLQNHFREILEQSQREMQQHFAAQAAQAQLHQNRVGQLIQRELFTVRPETTLCESLRRMDTVGLGSILVTSESQELLGIFTYQDLLKRVVLPQVALQTAISAVMTPQPFTLDADQSVEAAAQLMVHKGIRHIPITRAGRLIGLISERDLFALQRFTLGNLSAAIHAADNMSQLRKIATHVRSYARNLLSQGVTGHRLTQLVSYLNDLLTQKVVSMLASQFGVNALDYCWLALGSEGREEQTIATDQDNALLLADHVGASDRQRFLVFAKAANQALAECGFPLCRGNVMASNPDYCRTSQEWMTQCERWIHSGSPQSLLQASIFFDFRPVVGQVALVKPLAQCVLEQGATPRFLSQMASNAQNWRVPLTLFGGLDSDRVDGRQVIDIKKNGIALVVDFARIYALAHRVEARNTSERLKKIAQIMGRSERDTAEWVGTFEVLQTWRLRAQLKEDPPGGNPNALDMEGLSRVDKVSLKACLRVTRMMQQRLKLDYVR